MDNFQSLKIHHHTKVGYRKNLSRMRTLRKKKNCGRTKAKGNGREKKKKKRERRHEIAAKTPKELKRIKKSEMDKKDEKEM